MKLRNAVQVRFSDESLDMVLEAAALKGLPPSTYSRKAVEQQAKLDLLQKDAGDGDRHPEP